MRGRGQGNRRGPLECGYAMAVLLVAIAVMGVLMSMAMPVWRQLAQREKEEELVFRGEQYAHAIGLFQRKFAGAFPPSVDLLVEQRFLRKKYKDPMSPDGEFQVLYQIGSPQPGQRPAGGGPGVGPGQSTVPGSSLTPGAVLGPRGGVIGVSSKSTQKSIRLYKGRGKYNEWQFVRVAAAPGVTPQPGQFPSRPGQPGSPPGTRRPGQVPPRMGQPPSGSFGQPAQPFRPPG